MNPIRHSHLIRRVTGPLADLTVLLPSITTGPAALAALLLPDPPGWLNRLAVPPNFPPTPAGWDKHPPLPGPAHIHAALVGGMAGWQITLITGGATVLAAVLAVIVRKTLPAAARDRNHRRRQDHIRRDPGRLPRSSEAARPGPAPEEVTMNRIPHVRRTSARRASPPGTGEPHPRQPNGQEPHLASRPGSDGLAVRIQEVGRFR